MNDEKTPFQRVVDDFTGGCGCACHTGTGYRSSCEHCKQHPDELEETLRELAILANRVREYADRLEDITQRLLRQIGGT